MTQIYNVVPESIYMCKLSTINNSIIEYVCACTHVHVHAFVAVKVIVTVTCTKAASTHV